MAHEIELPQTLARVDLFSGLPDHVLSDLVEAGTTIHTPPGMVVVTQGSQDAGLQVVLEGSARVEVNGVQRPEVLGPGDYFGEVSVIDGRGRSATLVAGEGGLVTFAVSPLNFSPLIDRHPALARALLRALCARIRAIEEPAASVSA